METPLARHYSEAYFERGGENGNFFYGIFRWLSVVAVLAVVGVLELARGLAMTQHEGLPLFGSAQRMHTTRSVTRSATSSSSVWHGR